MVMSGYRRALYPTYIVLHTHFIFFRLGFPLYNKCHQLTTLNETRKSIVSMWDLRSFSHGVGLSPFGTVIANWPIVPAPDDDDGDCGAISHMRIDRRTDILGENLSQCQFVHHKSHMTWPVLEHVICGGKRSTISEGKTMSSTNSCDVTSYSTVAFTVLAACLIGSVFDAEDKDGLLRNISKLLPAYTSWDLGRKCTSLSPPQEPQTSRNLLISLKY
jgi:hypothetical protein